MTSQSDRYGQWHKQLRAEWAVKVAAGDAVCTRCGRSIAPGAAWHLDHADGGGPRDYLGPAHEACNTRAGGRRGGLARSRPKRERRVTIEQAREIWAPAVQAGTLRCRVCDRLVTDDKRWECPPDGAGGWDAPVHVTCMPGALSRRRLRPRQPKPDAKPEVTPSRDWFGEPTTSRASRKW